MFNKNNVKVSYSCMPNIDAIISSTNKAKLRQDTEKGQTDGKPCSCAKDKTCPVGNKCKTRSVVYEATIHHDNTKVKYIGMTGNEFKDRYTAHIRTTKNPEKRKETELSKYIWSLKDKDIDYKITWKILQTARAYVGGAIRCNLCLAEKYHILMNNNIINKKTELLNKCPHRRKYLIKKVNDNI